jgi:lipoteichoic acid synthase
MFEMTHAKNTGTVLPPWTVIPGIFLLGRLASIAGLYGLDTPNGDLVAMVRKKFVLVALTAEVGTMLLFAFLFRLLWAWMGHRSAGRSSAGQTSMPAARRMLAVSIAGIAFFASYALFSQIDTEIRRWMGLRFNLVFLRRTLAGGLEPGFWHFLFRSLCDDLPGTGWALLSVFMPLGFAVFWLRRSSRMQAWPERPPWWQASVAVLLLGAFSLGSSVYLEPALRKWRLIGPAIYGLTLDVGREIGGSNAPHDMEQAVAALQRQIGNPHGSPTYPLWRTVPDEAQRLAEFRARPLEQKPDVILLVIESLRGWIPDWRDPQAARLAPNMAALWKERGVAYPYAHSNGFPSGEGNMSVHLGLWSHPRRAIFAEHLAIHSLSLPEILGRAGYHRLWFTASDPSFDNMQPWIRRWYDDWVIDRSGDESLTRKMIERYDAAPPDAPRLMTMYTGTMHPPFRVPASFGPRLEDPDQAYLQALRFTDRALGKLFDHLRASGRWQHTVVICVGDHGQPSPWQLAHAEGLPPAHVGFTWVGMLLAAPGLGPGKLDLATVTHADIPPTVLALADLQVSNHFMGRDLLSPAPADMSTLSLIYGGLGITRKEVRLSGTLDDPSYVRKVCYDQRPFADSDSFEQIMDLPVTDADREELARTREMMRAYGTLLDHDRLRPRP